jgi:hypothetical protein
MKAVMLHAMPWILVGSGVVALVVSTVLRSQLVRFSSWNHREGGGRFWRLVLPARWSGRLAAYWERPDTPLRMWVEVACDVAAIIIGATWIWLR